MRRGTTFFAVFALIALFVPACAMMAKETEKDEKDEKNEVKVKIDQVPQAVRATLTDEAKGAKLPDEVDKETDEGKTIYEADVMIKDKNYEIKVAEDGTLISKKLDQEDEKKEGKEKDEKDEKNEKK